ncbi:hypothetical protein [Caballeronia telluris]|uniref:hypothetical protein n=1 Tax=Caballeronia telluris TaxID=326475 RepID=UPI000F746A16|nr:hypothetical protein [Caballeronia telluris]
MTNELFEAALGINAPWYVQGVDFDTAKRQLTIAVWPYQSRALHIPSSVESREQVYSGALDGRAPTWGCRRRLFAHGVDIEMASLPIKNRLPINASRPNLAGQPLSDLRVNIVLASTARG